MLFHFLIPGQSHFVTVLASLCNNTKLHYLQVSPLCNPFPFCNKVATVCNKDYPLYNESVPSIYGKKSLKMLKASITQCLSQDRISKRILDFFRELMETIDQICRNNAES